MSERADGILKYLETRSNVRMPWEIESTIASLSTYTRRCPETGSRRRSCFPVTPKAGASKASPRTGGQCAPMPGSASCAGTSATAQRRATPTLPTGTWSTRRRRSEQEGRSESERMKR